MKTSRIEHSIDDNKVVTLKLDKPDSSANVLDNIFFEEFNTHLDAFEKDPTIKALIIHSAKKSIFVAGADLTSFKAGEITDEVLSKLITMGQDAFNRLNNLPCTTVAAIHGMALGGGLELALACDYRIASNHKATKLGLPEVQLGILPAWGGSTRLPRLIGLAKAMPAILSGKTYAAKPAKKLGIVDAVCHTENLLKVAAQWATKNKRRHPEAQLSTLNKLLHFAPVSSLLKRKAHKDITGKTLGNYPAPLQALEVMVEGLRGSSEQSFEKERTSFLKLMKTDESKNLINIFFLQERSKKCQISTAQEAVPEPSPIKRVTVLGAGVMGAGIAQWASARGHEVILKEIDRKQLAKGVATASKLFKDSVKRHIFTPVEAQAGLDRITPIAEDIAMPRTDMVIEAIVEKLEVKQAVFRQLEERVSKETVLATNTSALSIDAIAQGLKRPERVVGIHFFNPVHRMKLVEVVRGSKTSTATLNTALNFVKKIGKLPVVVKDSPGFLVNRILMPYLIEAVRLYDEGCSIEELDKVMLKFGMPMGPMRLIDEVGLDVAQHVATDLANRLPHQSCTSHTLEKMIEAQLMGRKSGQGFYTYSKKSKSTPVNEALDGLFNHRKSNTFSVETIVDRMALAMVNEAARCLEEHVVEAPEDVDFGMIMGTGWAPFRGGPLRYADKIGMQSVVNKLTALSEQHGELFAPAHLLQSLAENKSSFYADDFYKHITDPEHLNQKAAS